MTPYRSSSGPRGAVLLLLRPEVSGIESDTTPTSRTQNGLTRVPRGVTLNVVRSVVFFLINLAFIAVVACGKTATSGCPSNGRGAAGQPCCLSGVCGEGAFCGPVGNLEGPLVFPPPSVCVACGQDGQPCCPVNGRSDHPTDDPLNVCASGGCCIVPPPPSIYTVQVRVPRCVGVGQTCKDRSDAICSNGSCGGCGGRGEACCSFGCTASQSKCSGTCNSCGGEGEPCCKDHCAPGFGCSFVSHTCGTCGGAGQPCCLGQNCAAGQCSIHNVCEACGGDGQPCCWSPSGKPTCGTGTLRCLGTQISDAVCSHCGEVNEACCGANSCNNGGCCTPNGCVPNGGECGAANGKCSMGACGNGTCGGLGQPCCGPCSAPYTHCANNTTCSACGHKNEACCGTVACEWSLSCVDEVCK